MNHDAKGCASSGFEFAKRNRRGPALGNNSASHARLLSLTFILLAQCFLFLAAAGVKSALRKSSITKVFPSPKISMCSFGRATYRLRPGRQSSRLSRRAKRSVMKTESSLITFPAWRDRFGENSLRRGAGKKLHQIDKVANFANDPAAALACILRPMFARNSAGVYAVNDRKRRLATLQKTLLLARPTAKSGD